jgi:hypothetical protein
MLGDSTPIETRAHLRLQSPNRGSGLSSKHLDICVSPVLILPYDLEAYECFNEMQQAALSKVV